MKLWPHQQRGIDETLAAISSGQRRIVVTSPTGGGKTAMMEELILNFLKRKLRVSVYSNRKLLTQQLSSRLLDHGIYHGIRAAGHADERDYPLQISSVQTEHSRCVKHLWWDLHGADLVLVDEAHSQNAKSAREIFRRHASDGAAVVGFTATPLGLRDTYDTLIVAGTNSELRACGALVPAKHYGPDEPDMRAFKALREGEDISEKKIRKAIMVPGLWGRVLEWFNRLNADCRPTILFAPGVAESVWFAQQFSAAGFPAAHIDGEDVWVDGKLYPTSDVLRQQILADSKAGKIKVLTNRFVLREGIDAPWLSHCIFATIFGSIQSYLQSGGRILRASPGKAFATIQDHGGNWWRHGSLNTDRLWSLDMTETSCYGARAERIRQKQEKPPWRCPQCQRITVGMACPCGYRGSKRSRPVIQANGKLTELGGDIFPARRISRELDGPKKWERMYFRSLNGKGKTFAQARALYAYENNWQWPDPSWPLMPKNPLDLYRKVGDVDRADLN